MIKKCSDIILERNIDYLKEFVLNKSSFEEDIKDGKKFKCGSLYSKNSSYFVIDENCTTALYPGDATRCEFRLMLSDKINVTGIGGIIRIEGWLSISIMSISYTIAEKMYFIKVKNVSQNRWFNIDFDHSDIIFTFFNQKIPFDSRIDDIRIYIEGCPTPEGSRLSVKSFYAWKQKSDYPTWLLEGDIQAVNNELLDDLYTYLERWFVKPSEILPHKECVLFYGKSILEWTNDCFKPVALQNSVTYRFSWHAWHPVIINLKEYRKSGEYQYLLAAVEFASSWLVESYYQAESDQKYVWYDHGVAERLIAMILLYTTLAQQNLNIRLAISLKLTIYKHLQLLINESFYAYTQEFRYHNHALFQDWAIIATSAVLGDWYPCAENWFNVALDRMNDTLEHLVISDGEYAVLGENSSGYHLGMTAMIDEIDQMARKIGFDNHLTDLVAKMQKFYDLISYPDGRSPSFGDTFRIPNKSVVQNSVLTQDFILLPYSGYAVIKGIFEECCYIATFIASSRTITHKHEDNCSFSLYFDGIEWFIDPSFYSHDYHLALPNYLRSALAHNVLSIDDLLYNIAPGLTEVNGSKNDYSFCLNLSHNCYPEVLVKRNVTGSLHSLDLHFEDCITDAQSGQDVERHARLMFHCGEDVVATQEGEGVTLTHPDSRFLLRIEGMNKAPQIFSGQMNDDPKLIRGIVSHGMMSKSNIFTIEWDLKRFFRTRYTILAKRRSVEI